jgi:hypothetical protein
MWICSFKVVYVPKGKIKLEKLGFSYEKYKVAKVKHYFSFSNLHLTHYFFLWHPLPSHLSGHCWVIDLDKKTLHSPWYYGRGEYRIVGQNTNQDNIQIGIAHNRGHGYMYNFNSAECVHVSLLGCKDGFPSVKQPITMALYPKCYVSILTSLWYICMATHTWG